MDNTIRSLLVMIAVSVLVGGCDVTSTPNQNGANQTAGTNAAAGNSSVTAGSGVVTAGTNGATGGTGSAGTAETAGAGGSAGTGTAATGAAATGSSGTGAAGSGGIDSSGGIDGGQSDGALPVAGTGAGGAAGTTNPDIGPNQTLPPVTDYAAMGPFASQTINNTGPDGQYTMFRPTTLGQNGFLHPPLTWGNGVTTTPAVYPILLSTVASHGFVVIASNSTAVTAALLTAGLEWLLQENDNPSSELYQKLDPSRAITMGYSLGGGAALTAASHPNVIATIAMHPAPGGGAHAPVLLYTGTADTIVAPAMVDMSYNLLNVPAFYASLEGATHMEPVMTGGRELAPSIAWLRMWAYKDEGARVFFYGDGCTLCAPPWTCKTKNWQ
ncbi:MAG: hypothetical protein JXA30_18015 [Deltaproteobacteria bacterium]|nr:hypothetical protein [Deltaproteobacteria bacterium]